MNGMREFLAKVLPWEQSGENVFFNMHWKTPMRDGKGVFWDGRPYNTLDQMVRDVGFWSRNPNDKRDMYICMSSQSRYEEKISKQNKPYRKAVRFQANIVAIKSFFVDVDVKEGAYPTQQAALEAFKLFIEASDMPMPTAVVGSGSGGFHAHWVVERPLTLAEWQPVANALAHAVQEYGLIADTQCSIDGARILRIPGTLNFKTSPPKPVTLMSLGEICSFDDISETLAPFIGLTPMGNSDFHAFPFERRQPTIDGSELGEGIVVYEAKKVTLEQLAEACPFIADAACDGGANYNNPLWYMTLQAASFLEEGREAAHLMSFQHATYDPEQTDSEFDRIVRQHKERDIGWPSCEKIKLSGATQCATCPLYQNKKSPFNWAVVEEPTLAHTVTQVAMGTPKPDVWPEKYSRRPDGHIYTVSYLEDGTPGPEVPVCPYPFSNGWLQDNPWALHFTTTTTLGKQCKVEIALEDFGAMGGAKKTLASYGMVLNDKDFKSTQEFLLAWIQKLQQQKDSVVSASPFGWSIHQNGDIEGFTYAGRVWCAGTDRPAAQDDHELYELYSPHGGAQPWIDAAKVITNQNRPGLNSIIAAAFAAPLVRFTGHEGVLIAGYSKESGIGKTSAMNVGQAVWGHSVKAKQGLDDTGNSLFGKMGKLKSLPIFWDELQTYEQMRKFSKNIFQLTGGVEKSRMNQDLTLRKRGTWQTIMVAASNFSLVEPIQHENKSHNAGLMRLFEFKIDKVAPGSKGQIEPGLASRTISKISDNYGHAGLIYAQFIGANAPRIEKEIAALQDEYNRRYSATNEERFWIAAMALLVAASRYTNELSLTNIDIPTMEAFMAKTLDQMRDLVKDSPVDMANKDSISTILAQFLNAMRARHMLITNRIHVGQGKPAKGAVVILNDATKLDGVYVHIGRDDGLMRFSSTYLTRWMGDHELPRQAFTKALEEEFGARKINGMLGSGTHLSTGAKEYLYEIDLNSARLAGLISATGD